MNWHIFKAWWMQAQGGYVLKSIEPGEMLKAIKTILSGKVYYCSEVAG